MSAQTFLRRQEQTFSVLRRMDRERTLAAVIKTLAVSSFLAVCVFGLGAFLAAAS